MADDHYHEDSVFTDSPALDAGESRSAEPRAQRPVVEQLDEESMPETQPTQQAAIAKPELSSAVPLRPPVIVLGMHRSGTSAMAGALCRLGGWVGEDKELLPANAANPSGYFEREETKATLDQMLAAVRGTWSNPPHESLSLYKLESVRPALAALVAKLVARVPDAQFLVMKDPRLSLFSVLLSPLIPNATLVVCVRHPLAVARSLMARDHTNLLHALAMWEAYNVALCQGLEGRELFVWDFDESKRDRLPGFLGEVLCNEVRLTPVELGLGDHVHQHVTSEDEEQWLTLGQLRLWHRLRELADGQQPTRLSHWELSAASMQILDPVRHAVVR